jgi:methylmalonyl-CoA mutase cobalamin-binding domain/chain
MSSAREAGDRGRFALVPELMRLSRERGVARASVIVGGAISPRDVPALRAPGVAEVVGPGRLLDELIAFVRRLADEERPRAAVH